jgi:arylsulfatase A
VGMEWTLKDGYSREQQEEETVDHEGIITDAPLDHGFDYFFGTSGCTSDDSPFCFIVNRRVTGNPLQQLKGLNVVGDSNYIKDVLVSAGWEHEKADTIFTNRAIEFIQRQVKEDTPFFVYLALSLPHIPWLPAGFVKGTTGAGPRGDQVALFDHCVGEVDKALKRLGVEGKTILIVSSDNGPRQGVNGHRSAGKLRGYKGSIYEGGHRVPLIIRWPQHVKASSTSHETVCMTDFMATFSALLDESLPALAGEDSYNLLPVLLQQPYDTPLRESTVHHSGGGAFAIRKGDWKMIFGEVEHGEMPGDPATWKETGQLYNLKEDPFETNDLYREFPEIVKEMNELLGSYLSESSN